MNVKRLLLLHLRTTLRESVFVLVIIGFLFWTFINNEGVETFLKSKSMFQFYALFTMMMVGYAITVSLSFAGFMKRKASKFYQLYLLLPEKPSRLLIVEMLPTFMIAILSTWGIGILLHHKASSSFLWLILPIIGSGLFTWGLGTVSLTLTLQMSNVKALNAVLFLFLFVLVRIPKYIIKELGLATGALMAISVLLALIGPLALERINPEKVILSS